MQTLGLGTLNVLTNTLEADFNVTPGEYALRCETDTVDSVPFYFNWRVFDLTSLRFDSFKSRDTSVAVCEIIIKGTFRRPSLLTLKPLSITQLLENKSNAAACTAFLTIAEAFPVTATPVITITGQPDHTGVTVGDVLESLTVTATATLAAVLAYQWYSNTTLSNVGGSLIPAGTLAAFPLPADMTEGNHYYYCVVSAPGAVPVSTQPVVVCAVAAE